MAAIAARASLQYILDNIFRLCDFVLWQWSRFEMDSEANNEAAAEMKRITNKMMKGIWNLWVQRQESLKLHSRFVEIRRQVLICAGIFGGKSELAEEWVAGSTDKDPALKQATPWCWIIISWWRLLPFAGLRPTTCSILIAFAYLSWNCEKKTQTFAAVAARESESRLFVHSSRKKMPISDLAHFSVFCNLKRRARQEAK